MVCLTLHSHLCVSKCLSKMVCSGRYVTSTQHHIIFVKYLFLVISTFIFFKEKMKFYSSLNTHLQLETYYVYIYLHLEVKLGNNFKGFEEIPELDTKLSPYREQKSETRALAAAKINDGILFYFEKMRRHQLVIN